MTKLKAIDASAALMTPTTRRSDDVSPQPEAARRDAAIARCDSSESLVKGLLGSLRPASSPLPALPDHVRRVTKGPFAKTPEYRGAVTHDVEFDDPSLCSLPQPGPSQLQRLLFRGLSGIVGRGLRKEYNSVEIHGIGRLRDENHVVAHPGCMVILPTHTDNPRDALLVPGLFPQFPRISDGQGGSHVAMPHFVMKPAETFSERVVTDWMFGSYFLHMEGKPSNPALITPEREAARKARNEKVRAERVPQVQDRGAMFIYPEGRVHGPGPVQRAIGTGAVEDFIDHHRGGKNLFLPKGIAYGNLGRVAPSGSAGTKATPAQKFYDTVTGPFSCFVGKTPHNAKLPMHKPRKVFVNVGRPFVIETPPPASQPEARAAFREHLADEIQRRQALVSCLTLDSLVGELALEAKQNGGQLRLDAQGVEAYVHNVIYAVRHAQNGGKRTWLNEVAVDQDLYNPNKLTAMCQVMMQQLADNGWVDAQGNVALDKLGRKDDMSEPADPRRLHLKNPLTYWGRRQDQLGQYVPELARIVEGSRALFASRR